MGVHTHLTLIIINRFWHTPISMYHYIYIYIHIYHYISYSGPDGWREQLQHLTTSNFWHFETPLETMWPLPHRPGHCTPSGSPRPPYAPWPGGHTVGRCEVGGKSNPLGWMCYFYCLYLIDLPLKMLVKLPPKSKDVQAERSKTLEKPSVCCRENHQ